jgi:hypothetical protein
MSLIARLAAERGEPPTSGPADEKDGRLAFDLAALASEAADKPGAP